MAYVTVMKYFRDIASFLSHISKYKAGWALLYPYRVISVPQIQHKLSDVQHPAILRNNILI